MWPIPIYMPRRAGAVLGSQLLFLASRFGLLLLISPPRQPPITEAIAVSGQQLSEQREGGLASHLLLDSWCLHAGD